MKPAQSSYLMAERASTDTRMSITSNSSLDNLENETFDLKHGIRYAAPVKGTEILPIYKKSFAYHWMRVSLPSILEQTCTDLLSARAELIEKYGPKTELQIEILSNFILYLRSSLLRNRRMELFTGLEPDKDVWNKFIRTKQNIKLFRLTSNQSDTYIHRKLASLFENMSALCTYDFYQTRKQELWEKTKLLCETLAKEYQNINCDFIGFKKLLHNCLWCNLFGTNYFLVTDLEFVLKRSKKFILADNSLKVWNSVLSTTEKHIDFIVCNVGVDLFSLFLLAHFLLENKLTPKVRFHVRPMPWGISKTTFGDVEYMLQSLSSSSCEIIRDLNNKFKQYFDEGKMEIASKNYFWTSPYEYFKMKEVAPDLYDELAQAGLLFIQGEHNYRKLVSDMMWDSTELFITTLRGFQPTNICAIRLIKSDVVCGLKYGESTILKARLRSFTYLARFGLIQFAPLLSCNCEILAKPKYQEEELQSKEN